LLNLRERPFRSAPRRDLPGHARPASSKEAGEGRPKGGHALAILPGLTHYDMASSPLVAAVALDFLDAPKA
jgi:hypothetical protein